MRSNYRLEMHNFTFFNNLNKHRLAPPTPTFSQLMPHHYCPNWWCFSHWANNFVNHKVTDATEKPQVISVLPPIKFTTRRPHTGREHAGYRLDHLLLQVPFGLSAKSANVHSGWKHCSLTETHIALCVLLAGVYLWHFEVILWVSVLTFSQEMTIM